VRDVRLKSVSLQYLRIIAKGAREIGGFRLGATLRETLSTRGHASIAGATHDHHSHALAAQSATTPLAPFRFKRRDPGATDVAMVKSDVKYRFVIDMQSLKTAA